MAENTRIRNLLEERGNREILQQKAGEIASQLEEYRQYGFNIYGIIGVNRSPSCGVDTTTKGGKETKGRGVFMEILEKELEKKGINIPAIGSKTSRLAESVEQIKRFIE